MRTQNISRSLFFLIPVLLFSTFLMVHTFSYDGDHSVMRIATKVWSDFSAHIPVIRSFSLGDNFNRMLHGKLPEYPIYPGAPIRYHFLFYAGVGFLEKLGVRIDFALNIPSIIGFTSLLILIAYFSYKLFRNSAVSLFSVVFFLFNGSLSFLSFFAKHPLSFHTPIEIFTNTQFPAFGPWDRNIVSAFWNLNIFTNQRHLGASFALGLLIILLILYPVRRLPFKKQLWFLPVVVFFLSLLPFFHQPMLLIMVIFLGWYFLVFPSLRAFLFSSACLSSLFIIPQMFPFFFGNGPASIVWYPGYLIHNSLTASSFLSYWFHNIGLHMILVLLGWVFAPKDVKKITAPLFFLFIIANCFKFSVEVAANHKFFNFTMLFGNMLTAYGIVKAWSLPEVFRKKKTSAQHSIPKTLYRFFNALWVRVIYRLFLVITCFFLMFSGIIDFFAVINDQTIPLADVNVNGIARWIEINTPKNAVFANSSYLYHPASLAGRSILLGWPYFAWSAGYEENRMPVLKQLYETNNHMVFCKLATQYGISYITVQEVHHDENLPDISLSHFRSLAKPVFTNSRNTYEIYSIDDICKGKE